MANYKGVALASFFIVLTVFLSGCVLFAECETEQECKEGYCESGKCIVTTFKPDGLKLEFLQGSPPDKIHADETFDIYMTLTNLGSYTISANSVKVKMFGGNYDKSGSEVYSNKETIRGAADYEPFGGIDNIILNKLKSKSGVVAGASVPLSIGAEVTYDYQTTAAGTLCLVGATDSAPFCSDQGNKLHKVSNAPVTVSQIVEHTYPSLIDVDIIVQHVGKGEICKYGSQCHKEDRGYVILDKVIMQGGIDYTSLCDKEVRISSETNTATIYCRGLPRTAISTLQDTMNIVLSYKYKDTISHTMEVVAY